MLSAPFPARRLVRVLEPTGAALVLGSSQPLADVALVRARDAGIEVARRRSGGGGVLVVPGEAVWLDVVVPARDRLWSDDVGWAFHWLARAFTAALEQLGVQATWHDGPMRHTRWSRTVCFAGLGPGEVLVGGRKVIGLSSRRTRDSALFQCLALVHYDPVTLARILGGDEIEAADLSDAATGLAPLSAAAIEGALLDAIVAS